MNVCVCVSAMTNDHNGPILTKSGGENNGAPAGARRLSAPHELNEAARAVAAGLSRPPFSPGLLSGLVRVADFVGIFLTGLAIFFIYVAPRDGFSWSYMLPLVTGALALGII